MNTSELPPLEEYLDLPDLHQIVSGTYSTIDSLRWALRAHRAALVESGALIIVAGRMKVHPERFKKTVVAIGQRCAA